MNKAFVRQSTKPVVKNLSTETLLIQFSIDAHSIALPRWMPWLPADTLLNREERKAMEGKHSTTIIKPSSNYYNLRSIIPQGYGLSECSAQEREKISNAGKITIYNMVRLYLVNGSEHTVDERVLRYLQVQFFDKSWKVRAYHNKLPKGAFYSLNFDQYSYKTQAKTVSFTNDRNLVIT